jgi:hypothetical protein
MPRMNIGKTLIYYVYIYLHVRIVFVKCAVRGKIINTHISVSVYNIVL